MSFRKKNARHAEKRSLPEEDQSFLGVHLSSVFFYTLGWLFDIGDEILPKYMGILS